MGWRAWNAAIHRDAGYAIAALTIVYAASGIAVNHIDDWDPNYSVSKEHRMVAPVPDGPPEAMIEDARAKLGLGPPRSAHRPDPATLQLFYDLTTYSIDRPTGNVIVETTRSRPVLREMNDLHLNVLKGAWTLVADVYGGALILVALTGLFVLKGKKGIAGRGACIAGAGALVPLGFILWQKLGR